MKKLIFAAILAAAAPAAQSASDFALNFTIVGGLQLVDGEYIAVEIEGIIGRRFISVFGGVLNNKGLHTPASGTCFSTSNGGAFCNLQADHLSMTLDLGPTLSGTISVKSANGVILDVAPIQPVL